MSTLCRICQGLDFAAISFQDISWATMTELPSSNHDQYQYYFSGHDAALDEAAFKQNLTPYHDSLQSLIESANGNKPKLEKCRFCSLVITSISRVLDSLARSERQGWERRGSTVSWSFYLAGKSASGTGLSIIGYGEEYRHILMAALEFRVDHGSVLAPVIRCFTNSQTSCEPILLDKANSWIRHCQRSHKHPRSSVLIGCNPSASSLPARVITIGEDGKRIFLQTKYSEQCGPYLALSYCWGRSATLKLTASTQQELVTGIDIGHLPQTFRDAIWITLSLGHRNIWIDSLCIQQDDRQDWKRESIKMHYIYQNAVVTIAATRAVDTSAGFLGSTIRQAHVEIPYRCIKDRYAGDKSRLSRSRDDSPISHPNKLRGQAHVVTVYHSPLRQEFRDRYEAMFHDEPLSARAWALQERILSTRTLHFTSEGLYFECDNDFISERKIPLPLRTEEVLRKHDTIQGNDAVQDPPRPSDEIYLNTAPWTHGPQDAVKQHQKVRVNFHVGAIPLASLFKIHWRHLVSDFSQRQLSFPSDKLPAIAGIASHFANMQEQSLKRQGNNVSNQGDNTTRVQYHAGLFLPENGSIEPLQWQIDGRFYQRLACKSDSFAASQISPQRPTTYRAPTWSWASVDGAIEWVMVSKVKVELALIKDVHVEPVSVDNIYGEIASAWLKLEAILCPLRCTMKGTCQSWFINTPGRSDKPMKASPKWDTGASYSHASESDQQDGILCSSDGQTSLEVAILGMGGTRNRTFFKGLIIEPTVAGSGNGSGFVRRGAAFIRADDQSPEDSRKLYEVLKRMFDTRDGMNEITLY